MINWIKSILAIMIISLGIIYILNFIYPIIQESISTADTATFGITMIVNMIPIAVICIIAGTVLGYPVPNRYQRD